MSERPGRGAPARTRVLRVIARLNIGGPAIQAISLTRRLEERGYSTLLVRGREGEREGTMDHLAERLGVRPRLVSSMSRDPGPGDLRALAALTWILARQRPQIVHTHAAKAGTLGRLAALALGGRSRRVIVHTFHGHSLTGYFSSRRARFFLGVERFLARHSTCLIAVSEEVRDDLVELGVAPAERFEIVRLGLDLEPFSAPAPDERARLRERLRDELGVPRDARVVTLVARLVPIKRVDRFLRVAARVAAEHDAHFLVVGDGELDGELRASAEARKLGSRLHWVGFRLDMPAVCFASDVVALTSDNEGTPVSTIEALAAGRPVVSTRVGGVATVVKHGETGLTAPPEDEHALAAGIGRLLDEPQLADELAAAGREHVLRGFSLERLVDDIDALYRRLLEQRAAPRAAGA